MPLTRVASLDDPRVADFRDVRDRDLRGREGVFLAEGEVVLRVLLKARRRPIRAVLLAESRVRALEDALATLGDEVPVFVADTAVMSGIVGFPIHRGILASAARTPVPTPSELLATVPPGRALVVALEGVVNHDNVGGIFRNAAAFGADAVLLDPVSCDPLYRKAIRVSVGGSLVVPYARAASNAELMPTLRAAGFTTVALTPAHDASELSTVELPDRVALVAGAEGPGLAPETLASVDLRVRIPMAPGFDSLNVATATGIALFCAASRPHRPPRSA